MAKLRTPHQKAEDALTRYGLTFPETQATLWIPPARQLEFRTKTFCIFGAKDEARDELSLVMKLPVSAEMVQHLPFVRESKGWYKQHNWVRAHFGPDDDILGEMDTLRAWLALSYAAVAPKKFSRQIPMLQATP